MRVWSHLLQMRGLKLELWILNACILVASFTDAWIETAPLFITLTYNPVASFTDAWIETVWKESCVKTRY